MFQLLISLTTVIFYIPSITIEDTEKLNKQFLTKKSEP